MLGVVNSRDVTTWLGQWQAATPADAAARDTIVEFLEAHPDGLDRSCRAGHVTASAFVVDLESWRTAFVRHGLAGRWLQPGGHLEPGDVDVPAAAAREATEETGLSVVVDPRPLRVDIHQVRCRLADGSIGPSVHFDVGLLALTGVGAVTGVVSDPVAWWDLDAPELGDATIERLRHAARDRFAR